MKKIMILIVPILMSCQKEKQTSTRYKIDTQVFVSLTDKNGTDLLANSIDLNEIELESFGDKGDKPLAYKIDITLEPISPEVYSYHPHNIKTGKSSIELHLLYVHPNTTTIIKWNNGLNADTLRGEVVYDKKRNLVKLDKLFLNGNRVWTDQDGKDRSIVIEKNSSLKLTK